MEIGSLTVRPATVALAARRIHNRQNRGEAGGQSTRDQLSRIQIGEHDRVRAFAPRNLHGAAGNSGLIQAIGDAQQTDRFHGVRQCVRPRQEQLVESTQVNLTKRLRQDDARACHSKTLSMSLFVPTKRSMSCENPLAGMVSYL